MTKVDILAFLREHKEHFAQTYHISQMALFGSFARGDNQARSDVDIIYALQDGHSITYDGYIAFEAELQNAFKTKVDLINTKKLNPLVMMSAKKDIIYV